MLAMFQARVDHFYMKSQVGYLAQSVHLNMLAYLIMIETSLNN